MKKNNRAFWLVSLLIFAAFIIRFVPFNFPQFTSEEAKIAYRGYNLVTTGKDELGRSFPILFNSAHDYRLPAVSYLTAAGEFIFGKSEFGVRIPFIILGTLLVLLVYKIAKFISPNVYFWFASAFVVAISPSLIFLSKVPNETILLTFIFTLLFYLLVSNKNILLILLTMVISVLVSKQAWFILMPFTVFTLIFFQKSFNQKGRLWLIGLSVILVFLSFALFLTIPQAKRSLLENNFSIFSDMTIKNGIDRSRGQGLQSGWPPFVERILFNKIHYIAAGFLHWLSNVSLTSYFGQLERGAGAVQKVLIIPFISSLIYLVRQGRNKERFLFIFFIILTFPAMLIYPDFSPGLIVLTIPFMALIIAFGFMQYKRKISLLIILALTAELGFNLFYLAPEKKITNLERPHWIKTITKDVYNESINYKIAVSDDVVDDIVNFIEWYNPFDPRTAYLDVPYPYKFRQTNIGNIKLIGFDSELYSCKEERYERLFVSRRDRDRINDPGIKITRAYQNSLKEEVAYLLGKGLCIK